MEFGSAFFSSGERVVNKNILWPNFVSLRVNSDARAC